MKRAVIATRHTRPPILPLRISAALTVALILTVRSGAAQAPAERAFADSLFRDLAAATAIEALPPADRCTTHPGTLGRLCQAFIGLRRSELGKSPDEAIRAEPLLSRSVDEKPEWGIAWYGLGIARLQLARFGVLSKPGPLQGVGLSLIAGAGNALVEALRRDSTLLGAAEALALAPMPREGASRLKERLAMLRRVRTYLPLSPPARLGIARVELEAGTPDTLIVLLNEALAHGADSGVAYLELARADYRANRPEAGRAALLQGASVATSDFAKRRYREELAWVASPEELKEWDGLPVAERGEWLRAFWARRDVREGRADGERLIEHYRRLEYAMANFQITVPQVGRQRVRSVAMAGDRLVLLTGDAGSDSLTVAGLEQASVTDADYSSVVGGDVPFRQFSITQDILDDRGVIWIRHGKPDIQQGTTGGTAKEAWQYRRPGEPPLVVFFGEADFDGTAGASVLISTVAGRDGIAMDQLCGQLNGMCDRLQPGSTVGSAGVGQFAGATGSGRRGTMATGGMLRPEQVQSEVRRGASNIRRAVTTDAYPRTFTAPLDPIAQMYGMDRATGGAPRVIVAFAIPGDKLSFTRPPAAGGRAVYPIRVHVMGAEVRTGARLDLDTLRQFATAEPLVEGQFLTGFVELPVPPGDYATTLVLTQEDGRGAIARLADVRVPGQRPTLEISDVILGREGSGVRWNSGTSQVPLNPLNAYAKGGSAELYYQLSGLKPGQRYDTRFDFFPIGEPRPKPKLTLTLPMEAGQPRMEIARSVGLENLDPGSYRLVVTVTGGGEAASSTAYLVVRKKP